MPADAAINAQAQAENAVQGAKKAAKAAISDAAEASQKNLNEALDSAERVIREAARRMEKVVREGVETLREQADPYRDMAGQQFDEAQKYVVERVKERPVTATLAGLGVGLLLGLLLANRGSK